MPCRCKRFLRRSVPIATYNVTGIPEALAAMGEKRIGVPNVTLVFSNDINGMVSLKDAYMKMRYEYQEQVPVKQEKNTIKEDKKEKDKKDDKKDDKKTEDKPGEDKPAEDKPTNEQPTPASENGTEAAPEDGGSGRRSAGGSVSQQLHLRLPSGPGYPAGAAGRPAAVQL